MIESLGKRLFTSRLELISALDRKLGALAGRAERVQDPADSYGVATTEEHLRHELAELLRAQVAAMNLNNFIVRPRRRLVEKYAQSEAWGTLQEEDCAILARDIAELPSELVDEDEDAKRFDLLMLQLQLVLLQAEPGFERWRNQVRAIVGLLEEKSSIPMVREQMPLIQEIQSDAWWDDVTTPMLESAGKRLRALVKLIEKAKRQPVYTDFEDALGDASPVALPGFGAGADFERFRAKARQFLRKHENHLTIHKLRWNMPLTPADLCELERMLVEAGVGTSADLSRAKQESSRRSACSFARSSVWTVRQRSRRSANSLQARRSQRIRSNSSTLSLIT